MLLTNLNIKEFMGVLSSDAPTPGGGSAAALSGVAGVSLLQMVCNLTIGKKKYAEFDELNKNVLNDAKRHHDALLAAIDEDAKAYDQVSAAFGLPKETDEEKAARTAAIQDALKVATLSPFNILVHAKAALQLTHSIIGKSNPNAASDLGVAAASLRTAAIGAWYNILINISSIKNEEFVSDINAKGQEALATSNKLADEICAYVLTQIEV